MRYLAILVCALILCLQAQAEIYNWHYTRVIDGDTIEFSAPWNPLPDKTIHVRIIGIDTPEHGFRAQCESERNAAHQAQYFVEQALRNAKTIETMPLDWDKWGGRLLAVIYLDGKSLSKMLLDAGLARPYDGGKKTSWCVADVK